MHSLDASTTLLSPALTHFDDSDHNDSNRRIRIKAIPIDVDLRAVLESPTTRSAAARAQAAQVADRLDAQAHIYAAIHIPNDTKLRWADVPYSARGALRRIMQPNGRMSSRDACRTYESSMAEFLAEIKSEAKRLRPDALVGIIDIPFRRTDDIGNARRQNVNYQPAHQNVDFFVLRRGYRSNGGTHAELVSQIHEDFAEAHDMFAGRELFVRYNNRWTMVAPGDLQGSDDDTGNDLILQSIAAAQTPPDASGEAFSMLANETLLVNAPGVLTNDSDPDGHAIHATLVAEPLHGTLTLEADGSFTYEPEANFIGSDSFAYRVVDEHGSPSSVAVSSILISQDDSNSGGNNNGGGNGNNNNNNDNNQGGNGDNNNNDGGNDDLPGNPSGTQLLPGNGWNGPTDQPEAVGNNADAGFSAKAIARWDVVPKQIFDGTFEVGIVAFHINGIDRVDFAVNGGEWESIHRMSLNPRTGVWEYWVTLDASDFNDGEIELRAIAYPKDAGQPRLLAGEMNESTQSNSEHSLTLFANANGTQTHVRWCDGRVGSDANGDGSQGNPFRTIHRAMLDVQQDTGSVGGAHILLNEGTYNWSRSQGGTLLYDRWATIEPSPGTSPNSVILTGGSGLKASYIHLKRIHPERGFFISTPTGFGDRHLWFDSGKLRGFHQYDGETSPYLAQNWTSVYMTNSLITGYSTAAQGAMLVRSVEAINLQSDAFGDSRMVLNSFVDGIDASNTDYHPDVYQFSGRDTNRDNTIVYGLCALNAGSQGIFADDLARVDNSAFVNILIEGTTHFSQWKDVATNHLIFWHITLDQPFHWRTDQLNNVSVRGSVFQSMHGFDHINGADLAHNFFEGGDAGFTDHTDSDAGFADRDGDDYTPGANSPLRDAVTETSVPTDMLGTERPNQCNIGALEDDE